MKSDAIIYNVWALEDSVSNISATAYDHDLEIIYGLSLLVNENGSTINVYKMNKETGKFNSYSSIATPAYASSASVVWVVKGLGSPVAVNGAILIPVMWTRTDMGTYHYYTYYIVYANGLVYDSMSSSTKLTDDFHLLPASGIRKRSISSTAEILLTSYNDNRNNIDYIIMQISSDGNSHTVLKETENSTTINYSFSGAIPHYDYNKDGWLFVRYSSDSVRIYLSFYSHSNLLSDTSGSMDANAVVSTPYNESLFYINGAWYSYNAYRTKKITISNTINVTETFSTNSSSNAKKVVHSIMEKDGKYYGLVDDGILELDPNLGIKKNGERLLADSTLGSNNFVISFDSREIIQTGFYDYYVKLNNKLYHCAYTAPAFPSLPTSVKNFIKVN